jgi:hypothetical protein
VRIQLTKNVGFGSPSPGHAARMARNPRRTGSGGPSPGNGGASGSRRRAARAHARAADARAVGPAELVSRRERMATQYAELQWDLGGLVYEMAARDHFRMDLIVRRAAELQAVDAELAEIERMLRLDHAGASGTCPGCGALHSRGAVFCWQCGKNLMAQQPVSGPPAPPASANGG